LAEVLLALSLVIGAVVIVSGVFPYSYIADQKAWKKSSAQRLAGATVEKLRGADFSTVDDSSAVITENETPFKIDVSVQNSTPAPPRTKTVTCTVSWPSKQGRDTFVQETKITRFSRQD
jgi:type II secretory pathway pseudopilin PulG